MSIGHSSASWLSVARNCHPPADLHGRTWGEGGGRLVVLLHELGGATGSWDLVAPHLARGGLRVVAFDQRGSGRSEKAVGPYSMDLLADDLAEICHRISPNVPVLFGGLAMGSVTGLHFACRCPHLVDKLALLSPASAIDERAQGYLRMRATLVEREGMRAAFAASFDNAFPAYCRSDEASSIYREQFLGNCPAAYAATSRALADFGGYDRLEHLSAPTLLVSGRHDFIWPPEHGAALARRMKCARAMVAETGHFPPLQAPAAVARLLIDFFADDLQ